MQTSVFNLLNPCVFAGDVGPDFHGGLNYITITRPKRGRNHRFSDIPYTLLFESRSLCYLDVRLLRHMVQPSNNFNHLRL